MQLYFWKADELARALKQGSITRQDKIIYGLLFLCILYFYYQGFTFGDMAKAHTMWQMFFTIILPVAAPLITLGLFYLTNKGGDGRFFFQRYVCLSVPFFIRFMITLATGCVLLVGALYAGDRMTGFALRDVPAWISFASAVVMTGAILVCYYRGMNRLFRIVSGQER